jgi:predicted metal-dependent hydrolase
MKSLFEWHFAEEIEHKAVAFDVFQSISGNYFLRILAAVCVFPIFYLLITFGTIYLLFFDGKLFSRSTWQAAFNHFLFEDKVFFKTWRFFLEYLKPGFHPWQINDYELAGNFLKNTRLLVVEMNVPASAR